MTKARFVFHDGSQPHCSIQDICCGHEGKHALQLSKVNLQTVILSMCSLSGDVDFFFLSDADDSSYECAIRWKLPREILPRPVVPQRFEEVSFCQFVISGTQAPPHLRSILLASQDL